MSVCKEDHVKHIDENDELLSEDKDMSNSMESIIRRLGDEQLSLACQMRGDVDLDDTIEQIRDKLLKIDPTSALKVDLSQNYFSKSSIKAFEDLLCDFPLLYLDLSVNNLAFNDFSTSTNAVLRYFVAFKWCLYYDLY